MDELAQKLHISKLDDWYGITNAMVKEHKGSGLLNCYNGSLRTGKIVCLTILTSLALATIYPEHSWNTSKFTQLPQGYWKDIHHQRTFFEQLANKLGITKPTDWYSITNMDIIAHGGSGLLSRYYGNSLRKGNCSHRDALLLSALQAVYPETRWQQYHFSNSNQRKGSNAQYFLYQMIKKLFEPLQTEIRLNVKVASIIPGASGEQKMLEYDVST
jgi:hypothetical protein